MRNLARKLLEDNNSGNLLFLTNFGSVLYGTNNPNSDIDVKGIYLPNRKDMLLGKKSKVITYSTGATNGKNSAGDIDLTLYPFDKFISDLSDGESQALDLFFAVESESHLFIDKMFKHFYYKVNDKDLIRSKNVKSFVGYCIQQAKKYGLKGSKFSELLDLHRMLKSQTHLDKAKVQDFVDNVHPNDFMKLKFTEKNDTKYLVVLGKLFELSSPLSKFRTSVQTVLDSYGDRAKQAMEDGNVDFKGLSHAFRVLQEMEEFVKTGKITFPLKEKSFILEVKEKKLPVDYCITILEKKLDDLTEYISNCNLPEKANREAIEDEAMFVIKL